MGFMMNVGGLRTRCCTNLSPPHSSPVVLHVPAVFFAPAASPAHSPPSLVKSRIAATVRRVAAARAAAALRAAPLDM
eukprot:2320329-Prymnesium_polylepis.1